MKDYLKRLAELVTAGFAAGAGSYVAEHGVELSQAGLRGVLVAGALAAYGLIMKPVGDQERPTVK